MKKRIITSALALMSISAFADTSVPDVKENLKVTANVAAGCDLSAENINFGVLQMPLSLHQAFGKIKLLCSKNTKLTLEVLYSNKVASEFNFTASVINQNNNGNWYGVKKEGVDYSDSFLMSKGYLTFGCAINGGETNTALGKVYFYSREFMNDLGISKNINVRSYYVDEWNLCDNGFINQTDSVFVTQASKGTLKGIMAGEEIQFEIKNPQSANTLWGAGTQAHKFVSTGEEQELSMLAEINANNNPKHRMTPDTYQSSVNLTLTY